MNIKTVYKYTKNVFIKVAFISALKCILITHFFIKNRLFIYTWGCETYQEYPFG